MILLLRICFWPPFRVQIYFTGSGGLREALRPPATLSHPSGVPCLRSAPELLNDRKLVIGPLLKATLNLTQRRIHAAKRRVTIIHQLYRRRIRVDARRD